MRQVYVAFLWHQHQPFYRNVEGHAVMPWVRLHGIKDYLGMALMARRFPEFHHCINYVPSLLDQIQLYVDGKMTDHWLEMTRKPAEELDEGEKQFVLNEFFSGTWDKMILPNPRYGELLRKRRIQEKQADDVADDFSPQDMRDLQVWSNLVWFHPLAVEELPEVQALIDKDRDFSEEDKGLVIEKQLELMGRIVPVHKELQDEGSIEIALSPYYHPILPLLCRMESAHVALPQIDLPDQVRGSWEEDARWHVDNGARRYREVWGCEPRGMWPSEGSVSPEMVDLLIEAGMRWFASDEEVLAGSIGQRFNRDEHGAVRPAEMLYTPYMLNRGDLSIHIVFRDHALSDLIGFEYCRASDQAGAARDLISRLEHVRTHQDTPPLVCLMLDGENAWEFYDLQGVPFLEALYGGICDSDILQPVTVSEYVDRFDGTTRIDQLFSGSWIGHNFSTWVGHEEKNAAWNLLAQTRQTLLQREDELSEEERGQAWERIHIAEGSDWYWWYGDDHTTAHNYLFDGLFRENLRHVFDLLGIEPPDELDAPIYQEKGLYTEPTYLLHNIQIDGQETSFFEWRDAGSYDPTREETVMHQSSGRAVVHMYFGWDLQEFYIRLDPTSARDGSVGASWHCRMEIEVEDKNYELVTNGEIGPAAVSALEFRSDEKKGSAGRFCRGRIVEIAVPWADLGLEPGDRFTFRVEVVTDEKVLQRLPDYTSIACEVPGPDYAASAWMV